MVDLRDAIILNNKSISGINIKDVIAYFNQNYIDAESTQAQDLLDYIKMSIFVVQ